MTRCIDRLADVAPDYDAIVLDQWGVLHDGSAPYPGVIETLSALASAGHRLAVLSNSGKRAGPNLDTISRMGFPASLFETVMTSGEALWIDLRLRPEQQMHFFPIERTPGDAVSWSAGLEIMLTQEINKADALLLMGLPDYSVLSDWYPTLKSALDAGITVYCSNPDKVSPRAGGNTVVSPGTLANEFEALGGKVEFYGKPYAQVFSALQAVLNVDPGRILMVGDSLEHDIAGASGAGWDSLLVQGGIYSSIFASMDHNMALDMLVQERNLHRPTYSLELLH